MYLFIDKGNRTDKKNLLFSTNQSGFTLILKGRKRKVQIRTGGVEYLQERNHRTRAARKGRLCVAHVESNTLTARIPGTQRKTSHSGNLESLNLEGKGGKRKRGNQMSLHTTTISHSIGRINSTPASPFVQLGTSYFFSRAKRR